MQKRIVFWTLKPTYYIKFLFKSQEVARNFNDHKIFFKFFVAYCKGNTNIGKIYYKLRYLMPIKQTFILTNFPVYNIIKICLKITVYILSATMMSILHSSMVTAYNTARILSSSLTWLLYIVQWINYNNHHVSDPFSRFLVKIWIR